MSTVVITGGSRGIGAAAVELFAARGHKVYFLYEKNHEAASSVAERTGAIPICCDVANSGAVKSAFAQIGDVDILICNAGIMHFGLMSMMEEEAWDRLFAVNVKGILHTVQAVLPDMLLERLETEFTFMLQEKTDATHSAVRFCTSWATTEESVDALCRKLESLS